MENGYTLELAKPPDYARELIEGGGKWQALYLHIEHDGNKRWLYESSDIVSYLKSYSY